MAESLIDGVAADLEDDFVTDVALPCARSGLGPFEPGRVVLLDHLIMIFGLDLGFIARLNSGRKREGAVKDDVKNVLAGRIVHGGNEDGGQSEDGGHGGHGCDPCGWWVLT